MHIVIAGGSGFLGCNLARAAVANGDRVTILSRSAPPAGDWEHVRWDGEQLGDWVTALDGADALVNLAGRSVDCVKTPDHCDEILRSRVLSTRVLGAALRSIERPPSVWVQMATAHIYGDPPSTRCVESSPTGYGLAPFVGRAWETAASEAQLPGMRQVILRTSFVLGRGGGALPRLAALARWGLGGRVGHGRQGISWIHEEDMNRLMLRAISETSMRGVYLATAPNPVANTEFMRCLRRVLRRPIGLPALAWMVRLGAPLLLRTDPELALYGRYCVSERLKDEGFEFHYADLEAALRTCYRDPG